MSDISATIMIWAAITLAICSGGLIIADYIKTRRYYKRFNRNNERQLYSVGTRLDYTKGRRRGR